MCIRQDIKISMQSKVLGFEQWVTKLSNQCNAGKLKCYHYKCVKVLGFK